MEPISWINSANHREWILVYKADYILGIMINQVVAYGLLPSLIALAIIVAVLCNFALIRLNGVIVKLALFNFSLLTLAIVYTILHINSTLLNLRNEALNKRKESVRACKLQRRVLNGCRVYRMVFGIFCDMDFTLLMTTMGIIISYTVSLLVAF